MPPLDLTPEEHNELRKAVRAMIRADKYPLSPRIQALKRVLAKLDPGTAQPLPAPAGKPRRAASELELMLRASVAGEEAVSRANVTKLDPAAKRSRRR